MKTYKGIQLENLSKDVSMAHSRFFERNIGIDYLTELLGMRKSSLTKAQFDAISALNSVANFNYMVCNSGLYGYFDNGYDRAREPFTADDVKHVNKDEQVEMLRELLEFGMTIFPEKELENERLDRIIRDLDEATYEEPHYGWEDEEYDEYDDGLNAAYDFDDRYYKVNSYLEALLEAYAQYLIKRFERESAE